MNTENYRCTRKPDGCGDEQLQARGDFSWRFVDGVCVGMALAMPLSRPGVSVEWIPVVLGAAAANVREHGWGWDGNLDHPTLKPSLDLKGHWHGHLQAGRLISC
jgi:hypothetical protein